jgi:Tfp pilus assembly protein PilF
MSLLIKALDHLEKNKQAEKDKKPTGEYVADESLLLELVPAETEKVIDEPIAIEETQALTEVIKNAEADNTVVDKMLSLEEEAGLTGVSFVNSKYAKPKPSVTKAAIQATSQARELKITKQETPPVTNAKNKASTTATSSASKTLTDELNNQKVAAKVFVANKEVKSPSSKFTLITLGVVGALLVWLGLQGYSYIKNLSVPEVVIMRPIQPIQTQVASAPIVEAIATKPNEMSDSSIMVASQDGNSATDETKDTAKIESKTGTAAFKNKTVDNPMEDVIGAEPKKLRTKKVGNGSDSESENQAAYGSPQSSTSKLSPLALITKAQSPGVDPILLAAYQAFTHGEDANAQQQYRQVLQRDVRNVDALLGMAAIAQRQGRDADAQGWYQKVLEIEPRNTVAQSAIFSPQANADVIGTESRIKNMLAQQPDSANVHAALGNLYAEQNQWPSAQESYFNASRLAPNNADYAFNLAISLDQMGKSGLALKQYQRALDLLNKSGASSPDKTQLEARIRELQ